MMAKRIGLRRLYNEWLPRLHKAMPIYDEHWKPLSEQSYLVEPLRKLNDCRRMNLSDAERDLRKSPEELYPDPPLDRPNYHAHRNALYDVIHAAGAIEYTAEKLRDILSSEQAWYDGFCATHRTPVAMQFFVSGPHREEIQFEFANLLSWIRALQERLDRRVPGKDRARAGLVPLLAESGPAFVRVCEAKKQIEKLFADRELTNFVMHSGGVPPFRSSRIIDGRVCFDVPDQPMEKIYLFDQLKYEESRDLQGVMENALQIVNAFVDNLLSAFEDGNRKIEDTRAKSQRS